MKNKKILFASAAVMLLASCSDGDILSDIFGSKDGAIEFSYTLPSNGTRTVITDKSGFPIGGSMAVDGFQTDAKNDTYQLFKDDKVTLTDDGVNWTYSPVRYWDISSTYLFYAMYPYEVDHTFDTTSRCYTISTYTVANDKADQKDVMIAEEKNALPENKVTFNFNHLLSQVNFFIKSGSDFNLDGVDNIELTSFDLKGVKNTGSYVQTGYDPTNMNVDGAWTVADNSGNYEMTPITSADLVTTANPVSPIETGLLMLPQTLTEAKAYVSYRIHYVGGTTSSFSSMVKLPAALISNKKVDDNDNSKYITCWRPNYIYNYNLGVNPSKRTISDYTIDDNGSIGGDGVPDEGHTIVVDDDGNWGVDTNGDGIIDIPIVWEDVDGDGNEEGGIDADGDGHIDNVDGENENPDDNPLVSDGDDTNNPDGKDVILIDTDGDGICDTQLERDTNVEPDDPTSSSVVDWDGSNGGDGTSATTTVLVDNGDGTYSIKVDTDGDGVPDTTYDTAWEDIDGDGDLELGVDRDGDGHIDNVDGENDNHATPGTETHDSVTDGNSQANPEGKDAILIDTDGDGIADSQIEKHTSYNPDPIRNMQIEFSATVENFANEVDGEVLVPNNE